MNRLILADEQVIFRAGAARTLALEEDMRIIAQCEDAARLTSVVASFKSSIVLFSSGLGLDLPIVLASIRESGSRAILIAEKAKTSPKPSAPS